MVTIGEKIANGLALVLMIFIALLLGSGIWVLMTWAGPFPDGGVIFGGIVFISLFLAIPIIFCCCLRAWLKEQ